MRIAIAVDYDKKTIVKRTGQAIYFAIYENNEVVDFIKNHHGQGEQGKGERQHKNQHDNMGDAEHSSSHQKDIMPLIGCDIILAQAIGEHMKEALDSIGVKIQKIRKKDGLTADEAVKNFLDNNL